MRCVGFASTSRMAAVHVHRGFLCPYLSVQRLSTRLSVRRVDKPITGRGTDLWRMYAIVVVRVSSVWRNCKLDMLPPFCWKGLGFLVYSVCVPTHKYVKG
jgi:hypothetical protein